MQLSFLRLLIRTERRNQCGSIPGAAPEKRRRLTLKGNAQTGFTLLEILLAIAILGVAVTVIMQQFSAGLRIARTSQTHTTATIYAKQMLEEYLLAEEMEEGEASGTFDDGYRWNVSIQAYEDYKEEEGATEEEQEIYEYLPLEMFRIESVVSWMEGGKEKSVALATLKTVKKTEEEVQEEM